MTRELTFTPHPRPEPTTPEKGGAEPINTIVRHALGQGLVSAQHLHGWGVCRDGMDPSVGVIVGCVIPLPRAWLLASAMLVGIAVGQIAGIASMLLFKATIRPDVVIALVVGIPSVIGMLLILFSGKRWVTALGAFVLAIAPGWFGVLVTIQVVNGA
jgi:hypothetical protein